MTTPDPGRATLTARLRAMADWLDAHPGIPVSPYCAVTVSYFTDDFAWINDAQHEALDTHFTRDVQEKYDTLIYGADGGPWTVEYRLSVRRPECNA